MVLTSLRSFRGVALAAALICIAYVPWVQAKCTGLHAGITAQLVPLMPPYTDPEHVSLSFLVVNDSDSVRNVAAASWKLVINGAELQDSGMILGNGPAPVNGWNELNPGDNYQFGKSSPVATYFKKPGEYRIYWKAEGFRSSTILIRIPAQ
jgi:hypothetical protein